MPRLPPASGSGPARSPTASAVSAIGRPGCPPSRARARPTSRSDPAIIAFADADADADADAADDAGAAGGHGHLAALFADVAGIGLRVVAIPTVELDEAPRPAAEPTADATTDPVTDTPSDPVIDATTDAVAFANTTPAIDPNPAPSAEGDDGAPGRSAMDAAIRLGASIADDEIDAGADLLIAATLGHGSDLAADVVVAVMTLIEPVKVVGLDTAMSDADWMAWVIDVRDARLRALPYRHEVENLLATLGNAPLAALVGFLLQAATRRTPVLLDGVAAASAALLAREVTPNGARWWQPGARSTRPAHALALTDTATSAVLDLELGVGDHWFQGVVAGSESAHPYDAGRPPWTPDIVYRTHHTGAEVVARYREQCVRSDEILGDLSMDEAPLGWHGSPDSPQCATVREVVLHVIEETATHTGHLDIARELIDGRTNLGDR